MGRLEREFYYMQMSRLVAERGTCPRAKVGAIIVKDKRIVSTGYNGAPPGMPHCYDVGCGQEVKVGFEQDGSGKVYEEGCSRSVHAELNAIAFAARYGVSTNECEMWCTHAPCLNCAKAIISSGITVVNYNIEYRDTAGVELLDKSLVEVRSQDD